MNLVREISLQTIEILTLIFGILGMTLALMLLFAPRIARNLSSIFNRSLDMDRKLGFLDREIQTENLVYAHPLLLGVLLLAGSGFAFLFFLFKFDPIHFASIFFGNRQPTELGEILFQTIAWIGRVVCLFGVAAGVGLILAPKTLRAIEQRLNRWIETRVLFDKINRPVKSLDMVFFRYPIFFGLLAGSISCLLIVLSIINLLH
jgi:hypothetical protein